MIKRIIVTAEIPEELLQDWRLWIVLHGGKVLVPRKAAEEGGGAEECKEPETDWSKVKVDTLILVRDSEDRGWIKRHFAEYKDGFVYAWRDGHTSWTTYGMPTAWKYAKLAESEEE